MTWTRLDDTWTDDQVLAELSFPDRWHYLAMIQFCSRTKKYDGILRTTDARRCSDHPDPVAAIDNLVATGLVVALEKGFKIPLIDDHIPPPSVRESSEQSRIRKQRSRKHKNGDHSMCLPENCNKAPGTGDATEGASGDVTGDVTRDTGTGQDRTGQALYGGDSFEEAFDPETGEVFSEEASAVGPEPDREPVGAQPESTPSSIPSPPRTGSAPQEWAFGASLDNLLEAQGRAS